MRRRTKPVPVLFAELAWASWQTMTYRLGMMAAGTCSPAEFRRMAAEKVQAAQRSMLAATLPGRRRGRAILAPWHRAASANAKRLRRRKRS